ncbi:MAG: transcriptional repressor LexA [Paraclostridium bifermentans]|uniref:transcriptional repressor LexA n=1 Tax=Paraclostridium bifermentans TaxID=1490 RepID=UPI001E1012ED|nr:transcriptional repressor LexA [Paraclostridium bifermentans]MBS6509673.1 transcriptional repressor LexA [Paraclostridium bifermentans]
MSELSKSQTKILETIILKINEDGYPPSVREICITVGLKSTATVHGHLNKLEELGYIKRNPTKPRAIEILRGRNSLELNEGIIELPVIEFLNNGLGVEESLVENIKFPSNFVMGSNNFVFKVNDEKIIKTGASKNDYMIINRKRNVLDGELVLGMLENSEVVLGRYFKKNEIIKIEFQNSFCEPLTTELNKFNIVGKVEGYFRTIK